MAPNRIGERLGLSPSYLAKVARFLVKAGILRAHRGAYGGVSLGRPPEEITLLSVVEACQGVVLGCYCQESDDLELTCAYHCAMSEVYDASVRILSRWTLADLAAKPCPAPEIAESVHCRMGEFPTEDESAESVGDEGGDGA